MDFQWNMFADEMKRVYDNYDQCTVHRGIIWNNAVVFNDDEVMGNADQFLRWAAETYNYQDAR